MDHGAKLIVKACYDDFIVGVKPMAKQKKNIQNNSLARNIESHKLSPKIKIECTGKYMFLQKIPVT